MPEKISVCKREMLYDTENERVSNAERMDAIITDVAYILGG